MALSYISGLLSSYQYSMGLLEIQQCIFCLRIFPSYSNPRRLDIVSMCIHLEPSSLLWSRMIFPFADPKVSQSLEAFVQCLTSLPRALWPGCLPPSLPRAAGIQAWSASCSPAQASPSSPSRYGLLQKKWIFFLMNIRDLKKWIFALNEYSGF